MVLKVDDPTDPLDNLSAEERAAIEDEPDLAHDDDALAADDAGDAAGDAADPGEQAAADAGDGKPADKPKEDAAAVPPDDDDDDDTFVPDYRADPKRIEDLTAQITAVSEQSEALRKQLAEGEISTTEFLEAKEALDDQRIDAKAELKALTRATEMSQAAQEQLWESQQRRFFAAEENQIFRDDKDPVMFAALNRQVVLIANENPQKSGAAVLREAAALVRARFDPAAKPADKSRQAAAERSRRQAESQAALPKTLTEMPQASDADPDLGADPYADIDEMLGSDDPLVQLEAERRIARLSDADQARFGTVRH